MYKSLYFSIFLACIVFTSCEEENFIPKPRGYFAIELPAKSYQQFTKEGYPYTFEYPGYAAIEKDSMFFDEKTENPWWININIESLNAKLYMSYKMIGGKNTLISLLDDSYKLSHYHTKKADYIRENKVIHAGSNVHGLIYDVGGNAASALQFFVTDSVNHFIRGALYFNATPNVDSLQPLNDFLREDIEHLINTLKWTR